MPMKPTPFPKTATTLLTAFTAGVLTLPLPCSAESVTLSNDLLQVEIDPAKGARGTSFKFQPEEYEFMLQWSEIPEGRRAAGSVRGGIFGGVLSGSYNSSQTQEPYEVESVAEREVVLVYKSEHPMLDGLEERRTIRLDEDQPVVWLQIEVTNRSEEVRTIYYRIQDWIGTGAKRGVDSVYVVPEASKGLDVFSLSDPAQRMNEFYFSAERWYALMDFSADVGLLVEIEEIDPAMTFFWGSTGSDTRTAELLLPRKELAPGEAFKATIRYAVFQPAQPETGDEERDALLSAESIMGELNRSRLKAGDVPPYNAVFTLAPTGQRVTLEPVHFNDESLLEADERPAPDLTLESIRISGTPGEAVPFAVSIAGRDQINDAKVTLSSLEGPTTVPADAAELRYVSWTDGFLARDWGLANDFPEDIGGLNSPARDAKKITPFSLDTGERARVWNQLRIPEDAPPGLYRGTWSVEQEEDVVAQFEVFLHVEPFQLERAPGKHYGGFFRYYLKDDPEDDRQDRVDREAYRAALEQLDDAGYNSSVIYVTGKENIFWVLDQCVDLGWTDGSFVLIAARDVTPEELEERYGQYDMTFLGWGIDEPSTYPQIQPAIDRYHSILRAGHTPTFTPNVPLGLILSDQLEEIVPIVALSGNAPYALDLSRRYADSGRSSYWYNTGMALPSVEKRLMRGIYFWKEPVQGIFDWGEDGRHPREPGRHKLAVFAGTEPLPRVGRENISQALLDMHYLHTLQAALEAHPDSEHAPEAEEFLDWVRTRFHDDWHAVDRGLASGVYLDKVRREAARHTARLLHESQSHDQSE